MGLTYFKRFRMEVDLTRDSFECPELPVGYQLMAFRDALIEALQDRNQDRNAG